MILSGWLNHLVAAFGSTEISGKRIPKEADERYERILAVQARVSSSRAHGWIDLECSYDDRRLREGVLGELI